jgi:exodeoxyribonuclease V beta subunit
LRQRILDQYPVALIDEFQDTSPVQLRIFDRLYRIADNEPTRALLLIGDPKQAIYRFRGADINSYLQARRATQGRHHVLDTNFRSTKALVDAVNHVFQQAEGRPGEGAFLYRDAAAGGTSELPFVEVQAQGRAEHFATAQGPAAALTLVTDADLRNAVKSHAVYAALCAERIVAWLNDPQAGFSEDTKPWRRVRPADVAVLVRTGKEADAVRRALRQRGLASVYLSDKDTVFSTPEAADLLRLLRAVAAPRDVRLARAALATALLGLPLEELLQLAQDDERFDRQCETLQQLNTTWKAQGVLAMLRRALHVFGVPAQLLAQPGGTGERSLTNVLHLAELLQAASVQMEGEQALIRWLGEQIADGEAGLVGSGTGGGTGGDEPVLRLESDADLVQIVTIHKSKGLEYPLVLLPFASLVRGNRNSDQDVLMLPGAGGASELVLSPSDAQREVAAREDLREQLRLLYVALTRARHALWVGLPGQQTGKQKDCLWHRSAVGYLLSGPDKQPPEQRLLDVQALAQACSHVCVEQPELANDHVPLTPVRLHQTLPPLTPAPAYSAAFDRQWTISSYSALVRDAAWGPGGADPMPARVLREDEPEDSSAVEGPVRHAADLPWHRFPRGAFAGNFLHDQLEWLAGEGFALDTSTPLQDALQRRCERQGWGHRADEVLAWLRRVCSTPLPAVGVALAGLAASTPEMEFWFPSDGLQAGRIDALCRQHLLHGQARPVLPERTLKGLLMGFADLVFEHEGRYWVLDYKSNALGLRDADYTQAAMQAAMLEHRYDVQAALYLLALHRLLKARLGAAYRPAQQLGGAVYFFLRGVRSASAGCCTVPAPLALLDALDGLLPPSRMGAAE